MSWLDATPEEFWDWLFDQALRAFNNEPATLAWYVVDVAFYSYWLLLVMVAWGVVLLAFTSTGTEQNARHGRDVAADPPEPRPSQTAPQSVPHPGTGSMGLPCGCVDEPLIALYYQ